MGVQPVLIEAPHSEPNEGLPHKMFLQSCRSPATRQLYRENFDQYAKWHASKYGPMKLMQGQPREIEMRIIEYLEHMKTQGKKYSTCWTHKSALKLFYEDVDGIRWKKINRFIPEKTKSRKDRPYTTDELRKLASMNAACKRYVIAMSSSGCRVGALPGLKMRDLQRRGDIFAVTFYSGNKEEYISFMYPTKDFDEYFEQRRKLGEPLGPDSPVFRDTYRRFHGKNREDPRGVTTKAIKECIGRYSREAGLRDGSDDLPKRTHGFRKRAYTEFVKVMPTLLADTLLGHDLKLASSYFRPKLEELEAAYRKAIPLITLDETELLKEENTELKLANGQIKNLEARVECISKFLADSGYVLKTTNDKTVITNIAEMISQTAGRASEYEQQVKVNLAAMPPRKALA